MSFEWHSTERDENVNWRHCYDNGTFPTYFSVIEKGNSWPLLFTSFHNSKIKEMSQRNLLTSGFEL